MTREEVINIVNECFRFGEIKSSKVGASKSVQVGVEANEGEESAGDCDVYGTAGLQCRPPAGLECLFISRGDEKILVGVKSRDWQVSLAEGEIVLQALGSLTPAYVHLKPAGDVLIKGANVTVDMSGETKVGATAVNFVALANLVIAQLTNIVNAFNTHVHLYNPGPSAPAPTVTPTVPMAAPSSVAATKTKAL